MGFNIAVDREFKTLVEQSRFIFPDGWIKILNRQFIAWNKMKSIIVLIALHMLLGKDFMWLMHLSALRDALAASQLFCKKKLFW